MTDPQIEAGLDPKNLIRESYRIEGISPDECRSIFLDWAISRPVEDDLQAALAKLIAIYVGSAPDHPMSKVMRDGQQQAPTTGRRGGRKGRMQA